MELPGDGHVIMAVHPRWSLGKAKLDCSFMNAAAGGYGQEVILEVRGQDSQHLVTHISHGDKRVALVRRVFDKGGKGMSLGLSQNMWLTWPKRRI